MYLEIDTLNRMAELGKHVGDIKSAIVDFEKVIQLCKKFPTNNESTLNASLFALGKVHLDAQQPDKAKDCFDQAITNLNTKLVAQLKSSGKEIKEPVNYEELLKDSIFDTDAIK